MSRKRYILDREGPDLEVTYSTAAVSRHLGVCARKVTQLIAFGERFQGVHPTRGGLYPTFLATPRARRIPLSAIERHKAHLKRLAEDDVFHAQMRVRAREEGVLGVSW